MQGIVNESLSAMISLDLIASVSRRIVIEAVVDTGFNGCLTLPRALIESLNLDRIGEVIVTLANGNEEICALHVGSILWNGELRAVEIESAETDPLLGMSLLAGFELRIRVAPGEPVIIEPMSDSVQN